LDVVEISEAAVNAVFGAEMDAVCEALFPAASCAARKPGPYPSVSGDITVGNSEANSKTLPCDSCYECVTTNECCGDEFGFTFTETTVTVTRLDAPVHWGQPLEISCMGVDQSNVVSVLMCPSEGYDYDPDPEPVVIEVCTPCHALSEALPAESEALMEAFLEAYKTATSIADVVPTLTAVMADEPATAYLQCMSCTLCSKRCFATLSQSS